MRLNIDKVTELIELQFVEDYEKFKSFMININDLMDKLNINEKYKYDEFCIDIKENLISILKESDVVIITPSIMTKALNNMIVYRILYDVDYENKIQTFTDVYLDYTKK
jgi:hypothetical protein